MKKIKHLLETILWPEVCPFCGQASAGGICQNCRKQIETLRVRDPRCLKCGKPLKDSEAEYCYDCSREKRFYDQGMALFVHASPVDQSIYQFKFHNQRAFAKYYAEEAELYYGQRLRQLDPDILLAVPLHPLRKRKRGFNQALLLAEELKKSMKLRGTVTEQLLERRHLTRYQKVLNPEKRRENTKQAFYVNKKELEKYGSLQGLTILIVDDIYTTGSTVNHMAKCLRKYGAEKVYIFTLSIGQG